MTATNQLYPFSTADSKAIPLDVIRPLSVIKKTLIVGVNTLTIPAAWKVATFYSPFGCLIQFNAAVIPHPPISGTEYADTLFVPANCVVTSTVLTGDARIVPLNATADNYLVAQHIQKWAGLALERQLTTR